MEFVQQLNLVSTGELMVMIALTFALTQATKQLKFNNKWVPWMAMLIGAIVGVVAVAVYHDNNFVGGAVAGVLVGGFTSGLFDGFKGFKGANNG